MGETYWTIGSVQAEWDVACPAPIYVGEFRTDGGSEEKIVAACTLTPFSGAPDVNPCTLTPFMHPDPISVKICTLTPFPSDPISLTPFPMAPKASSTRDSTQRDVWWCGATIFGRKFRGFILDHYERDIFPVQKSSS
jgi:hypothetical protein